MRKIAEPHKPHSVKLYLSKRFIGICLVLLSILTLITMVFGSPLANNLNTAGLEYDHNPGGLIGSILADVLLQFLGWGGIVFLSLLMVMAVSWIIRGYFSKTDQLFWGRMFFGILCTIFFSASVSALPIPALWPYATGLGGLIGDGVFFSFKFIFKTIHLPGSDIACLLFSALFFTGSLCFYFGVNWVHLTEMVHTFKSFLRIAKHAGLHIIQSIHMQLLRLLKKDTNNHIKIEKSARPKSNPKKSMPPLQKKNRSFSKPDTHTHSDQTSGFMLPSIEFLKKNRMHDVSIDHNTQNLNAKRLLDVLTDFGIQGEIKGVKSRSCRNTL